MKKLIIGGNNPHAYYFGMQNKDFYQLPGGELIKKVRVALFDMSQKELDQIIFDIDQKEWDDRIVSLKRIGLDIEVNVQDLVFDVPAREEVIKKIAKSFQEALVKRAKEFLVNDFAREEDPTLTLLFVAAGRARSEHGDIEQLQKKWVLDFIIENSK